LLRRLSCPGRAATRKRCCAEPGPKKRHGTMRRVECGDMGPGSAAHRKSAALRPGHETEYEAAAASSKCHCHSPRRRGIQYAAASRLNHSRLWNAGSPGWSQTRLRILAACFARVLPGHSTLEAKRAQGRPGADLAPAVRCAKGSARKPHSSIQVVPITRPSLRSGWTAYAVLSREPSSFWPPSPSRNSPASRRLTRLPPPQELDRSNDGQDHTVLPYARPAISPQFFQPCRRSRKLTGETNLAAPLIRHEVLGSRRAIRPALNLSRLTLPRPPQARLAKMTTT